MSILNIGFSEINDMLVDTISIEAQSETDDSAGGSTTSWITESIVDGKVCDITGKELETMQNINSEIDSKIYLKKGTAVTEQNRIAIYGNELFTNGGLELEQDVFVDTGTPDTNERSTNQAYEGVYSQHIKTNASGWNGAISTPYYINLEVGKSYKLRFYWYLVQSGMRYYVYTGSEWIIDKISVGGTLNTWVLVEADFTPAASNGNGYLQLNNNAAAEGYIDNISIVETTNAKYYDVLFVKNPVSADEFLIAYTKRMK